MAVSAPTHDPYHALRFRDYRFFIAGRLLAMMGVLMQDVAVGWQLYDRTHSALALGLTGLVSVTPTIVLALPAGAVADRFDRRNVVRVGRVIAGAMSVVLAVLSATRGPVWMIYAALLVSGIGYAFLGPAQSALISQVLPGEAFANGITWNSTAFEIAAVTGPAIAGGMIAWAHGSVTSVYVTTAVMALAYVVLLTMMRTREQAFDREPVSLRSLAAGLRFVFHEELILAAITLDLFAVLFGGATTLLPIFARDILKVGPAGLGWLRAAPSAGAMITALWIAHRGPLRKAGRLLLVVVAGFGVSTIVFGFSRSFPLSLGALFFVGAFDSVSVIIRSSLLQLRTPDALRGRVNAVNSIFVDMSNELGGFESGSVASLIGPTATVILGGIGTLVVVVAAGAKWASLRKLDQLHTPLE
jgi:MFS family permease